MKRQDQIKLSVLVVLLAAVIWGPRIAPFVVPDHDYFVTLLFAAGWLTVILIVPYTLLRLAWALIRRLERH